MHPVFSFLLPSLFFLQQRSTPIPKIFRADFGLESWQVECRLGSSGTSLSKLAASQCEDIWQKVVDCCEQARERKCFVILQPIPPPQGSPLESPEETRNVL